MRIVSDFHDYYDMVQAAGQDQTLVYLRTRNETKLACNTFPFPIFGDVHPGGRYWHYRGVAVEQFVVGFCGKVHPILRLSHRKSSEAKPDVALCYKLLDVDTFVERHFRHHEIEAYRSKPCRWRFPHSWSRGQRREKFAEFFDLFAARQSDFGNLFLANRCPVFVASTSWGDGNRNRECKIVYNESLKELEFFRIVDTFTAFQEIQMYFGAMAQPNRPIPTVSDKDMVSIKGFDKWSFRKPPKSQR